MRLQLVNVQAFSTKADVKKLNATEIKQKIRNFAEGFNKSFWLINNNLIKICSTENILVDEVFLLLVFGFIADDSLYFSVLWYHCLSSIVKAKIQVRILENKQKKPRKTEDEIKEELVCWMVEHGVIENEGLNEKGKKITKYEDAVKKFKESYKFVNMVK